MGGSMHIICPCEDMDCGIVGEECDWHIVSDPKWPRQCRLPKPTPEEIAARDAQTIRDW